MEGNALWLWLRQLKIIKQSEKTNQKVSPLDGLKALGSECTIGEKSAPYESTHHVSAADKDPLPSLSFGKDQTHAAIIYKQVRRQNLSPPSRNRVSDE